jgi:hypothetical protein
MLSEGRAGMDNVYSLKEGMATIYFVSDWNTFNDLGIQAS